MNKLGDILELYKIATESMNRSGAIITDRSTKFSNHVKLLVESAFVSICLEKGANPKKEELPDLDTMCKRLGNVDQDTPLPRQAQAWYYCALIVFLSTGSKIEDENPLYLMSSVMALINEGLLSAQPDSKKP